VSASWVQCDALQLWDYRKGALLKNLAFTVKDQGHLADGSGDVMTHGAYLYCGQFCTSSVVVAAGTGTNSVQAINLDNNEVRGQGCVCRMSLERGECCRGVYIPTPFYVDLGIHHYSP